MNEEQFKSALDEALKSVTKRLDALDEKAKEAEDKFNFEKKKDGEDETDPKEKSEDECTEDEKSMDALKKENETLMKKVEDMEAKMKKAEESKGTDAMDIKKSVMQEIAQRDSVANSLSKHIGSFDHSEMDLKEVVTYGLDKLELKAEAGSEMATINGYLAGAKTIVEAKGQDSKVDTSSLDEYINS